MNDTLQLFWQMLRIRRFEEKCAELYSAGKIRGFLHLYIGEEAIAVGAMAGLEEGDAVVSSYREHGHALARGLPMGAVLAEMYGKVEGVSRGRGGSMHLFDVSRRFFGGTAIVAGALPLAVGLALADKQLGQTRVTACFFGDGAVAEGEFHEALNLASLWQLPVLFLCENNFYAMGTRLDRHQAQVDLAAKAQSYRISAETVDGMDVRRLREAVAAAVTQVRASSRPWFLELTTYRFRAHSMFDAELYRSKDEVKAWQEKDPLVTYPRQLLQEQLATQGDLDRAEAEVADEVARAVSFAEKGTLEPVEQLMAHLYAREVTR